MSWTRKTVCPGLALGFLHPQVRHGRLLDGLVDTQRRVRVG
jgi:hypothetical protein